MDTKQEFLERSNYILSKLYDKLMGLKPINILDLDLKNTSLVIIDMVNGFVKEGPLSSKRVLSINNYIADLSEKCSKLNIKKVVFADSHKINNPEFLYFPKHCLKGDKESEVTDEIKKTGNYLLIEKNSTNGFLEISFLNWLRENKDMENFIIVGNCTDICIQQFVLSLKSYYNMINKNINIILVKELVETYDSELHYADLVNLTSIYNMSINGINIVSKVDF